MVHCQNVNGILTDLVDDPVVPMQKLTERRVRELGDAASCARELPEHLDRADRAMKAQVAARSSAA